MSELELLKNVKIFEGLSEEEIKAVRRIMQVRKFPANWIPSMSSISSRPAASPTRWQAPKPRK